MVFVSQSRGNISISISGSQDPLVMYIWLFHHRQDMWIGLLAFKFTDGSTYDFYIAEQSLTNKNKDCGGFNGNIPKSASCGSPNPFICAAPYRKADYIGRFTERLKHFKFLFKIFGVHKSFCGATDISVLDFWWHLLRVSKPEWAVLFLLGGGVCVTHYLRFTSGATPDNLLLTSMVTEPFSVKWYHSVVCIYGGIK